MRHKKDPRGGATGEGWGNFCGRPSLLALATLDHLDDLDAAAAAAGFGGADAGEAAGEELVLVLLPLVADGVKLSRFPFFCPAVAV